MEEQENKTLGAKTLSKISMAFATVWIVTLVLLKAFKIVDIEITDIIYSGISVVAVWSPTYLSIWLEKIRDIKFGK